MCELNAATQNEKQRATEKHNLLGDAHKWIGWFSIDPKYAIASEVNCLNGKLLFISIVDGDTPSYTTWRIAYCSNGHCARAPHGVRLCTGRMPWLIECRKFIWLAFDVGCNATVTLCRASLHPLLCVSVSEMGSEWVFKLNRISLCHSYCERRGWCWLASICRLIDCQTFPIDIWLVLQLIQFRSDIHVFGMAVVFRSMLYVLRAQASHLCLLNSRTVDIRINQFSGRLNFEV